jgi:N-acetylglucosamine kinase-like BadF-type ATPase
MVRQNRRELLGNFPDGRRPVILAIDAGASKVDVALLARSGEVVGAARHRAYANFGLDHEPPLDALEETIRLACLDGGIDPANRPLAGVGVYCLAGADLPLDDRRITRQVKERGWTASSAVRNDTFAVMRAGSRRGWGVAVVCGSGLNVTGVGPDGRTVRFPSLGDLSGDQSDGGGWLGRAALGAALRGRDGRGPRTLLESAVPAHFHMARPLAVMEALYVGKLDGRSTFELPPVVFKAAARGDAVSRALISAMADEIVVTVNAAIRRLRLGGRAFEVVLGGGILRAGDRDMHARIRKGIVAVAPKAEFVRLDAPPVVGAALLALDQVKATKAAQTRLRAELTEKRLGRRT